MTLALLAAIGSLLACAALGWAAAALVRTMSPRRAVVLLTAGSIGLALAAGTAMTALGLALIGRIAAIAADGRWSAAVVAAELPIPAWVGAVAAAAVTALLTRAAVRTIRILVLLVRAERACRALSPADGPRVILLDDETADAFTIAGIHGRVAISRRLLAQLEGEDRRMVTAHELAHLHHRHHLYVHLADIAAAANPLLRTVPVAVRFGIERWADEDAAQVIGDRGRAGRALARVALVRNRLQREERPAARRFGRAVPVLGVANTAVSDRVWALLAPAQSTRTTRTVLTALAVLGLLVAGIVSLHMVQEVIEQAGIGYGPPRPGLR